MKTKFYDVVDTCTDREGKEFLRTFGKKMLLGEAKDEMLDSMISSLGINDTIRINDKEFTYAYGDNWHDFNEKVRGYAKKHGVGMEITVTVWMGREIHVCRVIPMADQKLATLSLTRDEVKFLKTIFGEHIDEVSDMVDDAKTLFSLDEKIQKL